jgi:hypothetical protein
MSDGHASMMKPFGPDDDHNDLVTANASCKKNKNQFNLQK